MRKAADARTMRLYMRCLPALILGTYFLVIGSSFARAGVARLVSTQTVVPQIPTHKAEGRETFRVGTELDFPPYSGVDETGHPTGYAIELLKAVALKANLEPIFEIGTWNAVRDRLERGEIDVLPLMALSSERSAKFDFSEVHTVGFDAIFVRSGEKSISSEADLAGKKVIVERGDLAGEYLTSEKFRGRFERPGEPPIQLVFSETIEQSFRFLASGAGDAYICSQLPGLLTLQQFHLTGVRLAAKPTITSYSRSYAFGVRKGNQPLVNRLNEGLKAVMASGEYSRIYDHWFSHLDPEIREREETANLLFRLAIGLGIAVVIALGSITMVVVFRKEVNRKAQRLAESEILFKNVVNNLPGVVFSCRARPNGTGLKVTYISEFADQLTGHPADYFLTPESATPQSPSETDALDRQIETSSTTAMAVARIHDLIHPEDKDFVLHTVLDCFIRRERVNIEFRVIDQKGDIHFINSRAAAPTPDPTGEFLIVNGIFFNITEQKRIASLLQQQQSKMAASARLSSLGEMAGGIAHEINNPLAIINLRTHQLSQMAKKGPVKPDDVNMVAHGIEATVQRISRIVRSLQKVSRESENDPFEPVRLREIFDETFELCYQRMVNNGISVILDAFSDDLFVECRRVQISQVLINILNNAFDAVIDQTERRVHLSVRDLGNRIEIAIDNTGAPIPRELSHKIFHPFFTTKGVGKGTGLGLSISKGMLQRHGGDIYLDLESRLTRFVITLPKRQGSPVNVDEPTSPLAKDQTIL